MKTFQNKKLTSSVHFCYQILYLMSKLKYIFILVKFSNHSSRHFLSWPGNKTTTSACSVRHTILLFLRACPFRTCVIMSLHNFLPFVNLSNVSSFIISPSPYFAIHLHKLIIHCFPLRFFL